MILAHRIQLDPTHKQIAYFQQACGTARFVWNWALAEWNRQYEEGNKPNANELRQQFNSIKYDKFPWLRTIHRDAHSQPFANLKNAFARFFKGIGNRPKFKCRRRSKESFYIANDRFTLKETQIRFPIIGWIRMRQSLRFTGKIVSATVSRYADRWFVSIQVDVGDYHKPRTGNGIVGVDLGIKTAVTLSDGEIIESPMPLRTYTRRLKLRQRSLSRRQKGSKNREKQRKRVARVHAKISSIRQDFLHKVTTQLCRENQTVVVEDLCVKGMLRNHKLARAISDVGFGEFRRQMEYKSIIYNVKLVIADRWFPSSKKCSRCGHVKSELKLSQRIYLCEKCGLNIDRDVNAARNLKALCTVDFTETYARGQEGSDPATTSGRVKPCLAEPRTKPRSLVSAF
jgi:putative transposase